MPKIIRTMELLGYSPGKGGVCFGIAVMGSQAIIRNQSQTFVDRINFIQNASEEEIKSLAESFDREIEKEHHEKKVDLCCFFDELSIYQSNISVNKEFESIVPSVQSIDNVKKLAGAKKNSQYIYPEIKQNIINLFTYYDFFSFILKIKNHLAGRSFSMIIYHSPKMHASQIGFDAKQKQWVSSDHDFVVAGNDNICEIEKVIDNIFAAYKYGNTYKMGASIDLLLREKEDTNTEEEIDLSLLKTNNFNVEALTRSFNKEALSHLITCYEAGSRYDEMMAIFDKIASFNLPEQKNIQLLESKRANGFTLFHVLVEKNQPLVLQALFEKAEVMKLSTHAKIRILDAIDDDHPSLLILALQYDREEVIPILTDAINAIKDENTQARLLGVKWSGIPILSIAIEKGCNKTVQALINAISNIKDDQIRASLLEARDNQNIPALLVATEKEHIEISKKLIEAICNIEDDQRRASLLEAKDDEDTSALLSAVDQGCIEIVEMLTKAIFSINDDQLREKLLAAKDIEDTSALLTAAEKGCKEIVEMLIKTIYGIEDEKARATLLEAKRSDGMSASLMAACNGHDDISRILINAIDGIEDK